MLRKLTLGRYCLKIFGRSLMWSGDAVDPMRALGEVRLGDVRGYEWR